MPYCVKWESSSLGGCEVGCSGLCVETPATGTMGPIYSSGVECSMGGGGDGDGGGDTGGSPGGDGSLPGDTDNIAGWQYFNHYGYETVGYTLSKINTNLGKQLTGVNSRLSDLKDFSNQIAGNTFNTQLELSGVNDRLNEALPYIKETAGRIEGTNLYLSRIEPQLEIANLHLKKLADAAGSGGTGGGDGGSSSSADTAAIKGMMQTAMSWWSMNPNYLQSFNNQASYMSGDLGAIKGMTEGMGSAQIKLQTQIAGDLAAIKGMIKDGQGSDGGSGGDGGPGIDYSQMPGSSQNPLHVAGADYESKLCQGDVRCAFDLGTINQRYEEQKEALKNQYKGIQTEISEMFKFHLGGSASAPKCFDMFSIFGKSYSICPDSGAYWETLAAIMMFIFYFIALMIVARR